VTVSGTRSPHSGGNGEKGMKGDGTRRGKKQADL